LSATLLRLNGLSNNDNSGPGGCSKNDYLLDSYGFQESENDGAAAPQAARVIGCKTDSYPEAANQRGLRGRKYLTGGGFSDRRHVGMEKSNPNRNNRIVGRSDGKKSAEHRLRYTAHHEAGHAVIGRVLGLSCGSVTIVPDAVGFGCTTTKSPLMTLDAWDDRGRSRFNGRDVRSVYRAYIMELMAGREAAELYCGPGGDFIGDGDDIRQIENLTRHTYDLDCSYFNLPGNPSADFDLNRLRKATRGLCSRHREKIERVATALLEKRTLTAEELDALLLRT
jgi:hypothetical protein